LLVPGIHPLSIDLHMNAKVDPPMLTMPVITEST
jgi:hypothetical protein